MMLADIQDIESVAKIAALIIASIWTYLVFIRNRQKWPRGTVTHFYHFIPIDNTTMVLRLEVQMKNIGDVLIDIDSGFTRIQRILPAVIPIEGDVFPLDLAVQNGKTEIDWPEISERSIKNESVEIEPGETHSFWFDFELQRENKIISIYSYFRNKMKVYSYPPRDIGWSIKTIAKTEIEMNQQAETTIKQGTPDPKPDPKPISKFRL